ncbi:MAG: hypothetical protein ACE149_01735 [Armatimonadota bacterium]
METTQTLDVGWHPARGSYEEAVLSWQEQIERVRASRQQEDGRAGAEAVTRRTVSTSSPVVAG